MRSIRRLLGLETANDPARDTETVRRIAAELDQLDAREARFLAAFAYVLARIAHADLEVSTEELDEMVTLIRQFSELSEPQAVLVAQVAKTQAVTLGGTENYVVTRQFREMANRAERIDMMRCLFAIAAADSNISTAENQEISRVGSELGFTGPEVASVRQAFRDQLAVLKDIPVVDEGSPDAKPEDGER